MSLSLGSLASTTLTTFKGLAVAAAGSQDGPADAAANSAAGTSAEAAPAPAAAPVPVAAARVAQSESTAVKGRRLGGVLDAYA
jgi:hypothetical protein